MKSRLFGNICYACGAMDRAPDGGIGWRQDIKPFINSLGVGFFDPCDKPIDIGIETPDCREHRRKLKIEGKFDEMSNEIKIIRAIDLRMVDISHFMIVNIDLNHYACGTIEEITTANRSRKPIIVHVEQGKKNCPDWLLGMLGPKAHHMIFDTWDEIKTYLNIIAFGTENDIKKLNKHKRWVFFDFNKIFNSEVAGF